MKNTVVGKVLDNYRILQNIGRGGMGFVFKALNIKLNKIVAIKMIAPALAMNDNFMRRFEDEAKALAKLENPNIVRIYDLRSDSDYAYIVMEYVEGITLGRLIKEKGPIPWPHALKVFKQMLDAIEHAHKEGIIHRDIKPNNVLINRQGLVKITDFGLAKNQAEFGITQSATTGGTLFYMSPEQVRGLAYTDERSDIYALGFTFYEMLAGKTPFTPENTDFDIREAIIRKKFPPPHQLNKKIPVRLSKIVEKAIQKQPENRFQNVTDFIDAIDEFVRLVEEKRKEAETTKSAEIEQEQQTNESKPAEVENENKPSTDIVVGPVRWKRYLAIAAIFIVFIVAFLLWPSIFSKNEFSSKSLLSITSIPNKAFVIINGDSIGETPIDKYTIEEGKAEIRLVKDQFFGIDTSVTADPEKPLSLNFELKPSASIAMMADPEDAQVFLDGRPLPREDLKKIILTVGDHRVTMIHPDYDSTEFDFYADQGVNEPLSIKMNPVSVEGTTEQFVNFTVITDPVDAKVYLNDKLIGRTPIARSDIDPGNYKLRLEKTGYSGYSDQITVNSNQPVKINHKFDPLTGSVSFITNPPGARIFLNGKEMKDVRTPVTLDKIAAGDNRIVLKKDGYADYGTSLTITPDNSQQVKADLQVLMGALSIHAIPWGTLFVDNKLVSEDTNVRQKLDLTVGEHLVKATHPTLGKYEKTVRVENNKLTQVEVNFNQTHTIKITALDSKGEHIWADIVIDGEKTGDQTPKELNLRTGTYTIDVARNGYVSAEGPKKINVDKSIEIPIQFVLKKTNE